MFYGSRADCYIDFAFVEAWIQCWITTYGVLDMDFFVMLEYWFCFEQEEIIGSHCFGES
jgi:hypothetical protein